MRTRVYIGKLKGNQASSFSLNRNKSSFGAFEEKGWGIFLFEKMRGGVHGQLILLEFKKAEYIATQLTSG